jgi:archaellum component FlaG (FlaF/FlaG flagellin family)
VAGGKVFIHTAVSNMTVNNQAVSVTLNITNPGTCVTGQLPSQAGALAFGLRARETRLADLSLDIPPSACSGTYSVTVLVKNAARTILASHTAKFTVMIPTP